MAHQRRGAWQKGRAVVAALPAAWLAVFFLVPFGIVLKISLSESAVAQPPYRPRFEWSAGPSAWLDGLASLTLENYRTLLSDELYWQAGLSSLGMALAATTLLVLLGYPVALAMARASARWRAILVGLVILPFWTSFLIRVYAWIAILKPDGLLNQILIWSGLVGHPLTILNTNAAILIGLVYAYLPFMVLPLYATLERLDRTLLEAAADLGASPLRAFWTVTLPISLPGVAAGALICFIPILGEFVIPDLLGGSETLMIGRTLWSEFFSNRDWPLASAVAVLMLAALLVPIVLYRDLESRRLEARE
ncbi:MAG TPA: ABC transporter permease subunit [Enterovirga sp.]|nr:ABC transporter permease subunit [Enterovirga sp.]